MESWSLKLKINFLLPNQVKLPVIMAVTNMVMRCQLEHVRTWTVCVLSENVNIRHWIVSIKLESWPARAGKCNPLLNTNKKPLGILVEKLNLILLNGVFIPLSDTFIPLKSQTTPYVCKIVEIRGMPIDLFPTWTSNLNGHLTCAELYWDVWAE